MNALEVGAGPFWVKSRPDGPEIQLPLYPSKRTQSGYRTMSVSCHKQTLAGANLLPAEGVRPGWSSSITCIEMKR